MQSNFNRIDQHYQAARCGLLRACGSGAGSRQVSSADRRIDFRLEFEQQTTITSRSVTRGDARVQCVRPPTLTSKSIWHLICVTACWLGEPSQTAWVR